MADTRLLLDSFRPFVFENYNMFNESQIKINNVQYNQNLYKNNINIKNSIIYKNIQKENNLLKVIIEKNMTKKE